MKGDTEKALRDYINTMPSLPTSATRVLEICNNLNASAADLNQVISLDPVLVGRLLKLVNSAYYGLEQHITNPAKAIIMLGINTVKNLVLSTAVMGQFSTADTSPGFDMEGFWKHSLGVGVLAKLLARKRGIGSKLIEDYFTAGLLHDLGRIPLGRVFSKEYIQCLKNTEAKKVPLYREEEASLGVNHCSAGAMISAAWKLEGTIGDVLLHHHTPDAYSGDHKDILYCVAAANHFASVSEAEYSGDLYPEDLSSGIWEYLNVSQDIFVELDETVNSEIEKAAIFLKINQP